MEASANAKASGGNRPYPIYPTHDHAGQDGHDGSGTRKYQSRSAAGANETRNGSGSKRDDGRACGRNKYERPRSETGNIADRIGEENVAII